MGVMLRRVGSVGFDFSVQGDTLDEADRVDIAAFIDKWLDAFTSEMTKTCQRDQSRMLKRT
jgi:cobalamin biosynthesis protein CobT